MSITIKTCGGGHQNKNFFQKHLLLSLFFVTALVPLSIERVREALQGYKLLQGQRVSCLLCMVDLKLYKKFKVELEALVNAG